MGQLSRRNDDRAAAVSTAGSKVWLEACSVCARPLTIVAATKPVDPRCTECGPAEATAAEGDDQ